MLKVYQNISPRFGRGIQRVARAIAEHAPLEVSCTAPYEEADLVIHHVIGVQNFHPTKTIDQLLAGAFPGQRQAVLQYCVATTEQPLPIWWHDNVWQHCEVVWSYYDLAGALKIKATTEFPQRFYEAPLGVDSIFHGSLADRPRHPIYMICTSGHIAETEGVLECVEAAKRVGGRVLHLGPKSLNLGPHVSYVENIPDAQLAALYKSCRYVAGLRRVEGFELPAAEGLCSGAIPICFDQPHYRRWFEHAALYVPEESTEHVTETIEQIFRFGQRQLTQLDVSLAQRKFSWPRVVGGFWQRILHPVVTFKGYEIPYEDYVRLSPIDELPHTPTEAEMQDLGRPADDEIHF